MTARGTTMLLQDYARIERAIEYLDGHFRSQPQLGEVAEAAGLSEYHFQRLFRRWAGVSPKRFLQFITLQHAKAALREGHSVLHAAIDTGLSGPGRLHDHFVSLEAVTPGEYRTRGERLVIRHGVHPSVFGHCFVAATDRGICRLEFLDGSEDSDAVRRLAATWTAATLLPDRRGTRPIIDRIFRPAADQRELISLTVRGTNFQVQVWRALLRIPPGTLASYRDIARSIGHAGAERAVGRAVGLNPVAYLIPCHRVIRQSGGFGNYRWGAARKKVMLGWEASRFPLAVAS